MIRSRRARESRALTFGLAFPGALCEVCRAILRDWQPFLASPHRPRSTILLTAATRRATDRQDERLAEPTLRSLSQTLPPRDTRDLRRVKEYSSVSSFGPPHLFAVSPATTLQRDELDGDGRIGVFPARVSGHAAAALASLGGYVYCLLFWLSGSLTPCVILHCLNNLSASFFDPGEVRDATPGAMLPGLAHGDLRSLDYSPWAEVPTADNETGPCSYSVDSLLRSVCIVTILIQVTAAVACSQGSIALVRQAGRYTRW